MQTAGTLVVESRDEGILFLNPAGITETKDGQQVTINIADGLENWQDEDEVQWLLQEAGNIINVVSLENFDHATADFDKVGFPIPVPVVIDDKKSWERYLTEDDF